MINVLIVEDQSIVLGALAALLNLEHDISVVATATNGKQALALCELHQFDIVISDIEMPEMDGLSLARELNEHYPQIKMIILTTFSKASYIQASQSAKVCGYLLKDSPAEALANTVRDVYVGKIIIAPELISELWRASVDPLTEKEKELLKLAYQGNSGDDIAGKMHLSSGTIRNYAHSACQKLGANNRIEAANIAYRKGWL